MDHRNTKAAALLVLLSITAGGCDWLWPLDGDHDPHRCDPACGGSQRCQGGQCVERGEDSGVTPDRAPGADRVAWPDLPRPDRAAPELFPRPQKDTGPPCKTGAMECLASTTVKVCVESKWKTTTCDSHCKTVGYDYSAGCTKNGFGVVSCNCRHLLPFGSTCTKSSKCVSGLFCGMVSGSIYGFCSRFCKTDSDCTGGPAGTLALCVLTNTSSQTICGFVCGKYGNPCPKGMTCQSTKNICLPASPF